MGSSTGVEGCRNDLLFICQFISWVFSCWSAFTSRSSLHLYKKSRESYLCDWSTRSCSLRQWRMLHHCSRQWKAFIYVLNGSSFNDTWMLRFLGNFFVIPDKFIILTIKLIKHSAHSNSFSREEIFWRHRNPSSSVSQAVPCLLPRVCIPNDQRRWEKAGPAFLGYGMGHEKNIVIGILGFEGSKFSLPGSGAAAGQQQPLG